MSCPTYNDSGCQVAILQLEESVVWTRISAVSVSLGKILNSTFPPEGVAIGVWVDVWMLTTPNEQAAAQTVVCVWMGESDKCWNGCEGSGHLKDETFFPFTQVGQHGSQNKNNVLASTLSTTKNNMCRQECVYLFEVFIRHYSCQVLSKHGIKMPPNRFPETLRLFRRNLTGTGDSGAVQRRAASLPVLLWTLSHWKPKQLFKNEEVFSVCC